MFKLEKIKAPIEVLKPVDVNHLPLGYQYINHAYPNILLLAKKNSGKTNVIYNILKHCANKHTEILIFCPTWELDDTYRQILDYLDSKKIQHQQFKNIDNLAELMGTYDKDFDEGSEDEEEMNTAGKSPAYPKAPKDEIDYMALYSNSQIKDEKKRLEYSPTYQKEEELNTAGQSPAYLKPTKPYKGKYIVPEMIFIFDDCKKMLRNPVLNSLIATNRHYKSKVIISTQYFTDIMPDTRSCLDVLCIFPKIPIDKIQKLHEDIQLSIDYPVFEKLYLEATKKSHNFLYVDIRRELFKFNFDTQLVSNK